MNARLDTERPTSLETLRDRWLDEAHQEIARLRADLLASEAETNRLRGALAVLRGER